MSTSCPANHCTLQVSGHTEEPERNPGTLKGDAVGARLIPQPRWPLFGIYELPGKMWNVSQRGSASQALGGHGRKEHPAPDQGAGWHSIPILPVRKRLTRANMSPEDQEGRELREKGQRKGGQGKWDLGGRLGGLESLST